MDVEVFLGLVVDINLKLGDFILCFGDYYEVVCGQDFEVFSFVLVLVVLLNNGKVGKNRGS